jgi:uncharacterized OsmC-like protein
MKTMTSTKMNGLDTKQMTETVEVLKAQPALARFEFRNRNKWVDGGHNRSMIQGFYGPGQEDASRTEPFVLDNGEPPCLLGNNEGANPVEFLLHALAGCVTTTMVLHATARGINIESISTEMEGKIDLQGLLGLDESVSAGYESIKMRMDIKADCSDEELDDLLNFVRGHSPVCTTICRPVPVTVERVKAMNA